MSLRRCLYLAGRLTMLMFVTLPPPSPSSVYVMRVVAWKKSRLTNHWGHQKSVIQERWSLFLPALAAIVEEGEAHSRERGLQLLSTFLLKCSAITLNSTGIGRLLQESVFPILQYLPNPAPEYESARLLRAAYRVLMQLARAELEPQSPFRRRLLDRVIRDGILANYHHTTQSAVIIEILMDNAAEAVSLLGVLCVKHIKVSNWCYSTRVDLVLISI